MNKISLYFIIITLLLVGAIGHANDPREELVKNSVEQLNYLRDFNNQQVKQGTPTKQWYIYFLGGTLDELKNIIDETNAIDKTYLSSLNDALEEINKSENTIVYVAFTKYNSSLVTPLFPKGYDNIQLQETYVSNFFKGWNESYIEDFSIFTEKYQEVIKEIYEKTWLKKDNFYKENILLPFSMRTERVVISKDKKEPLKSKTYDTFHLYAPFIENDFDKGAFKELFKNAPVVYGTSPIEQKMEKTVWAIEDYFIKGERPDYKECEELLNSETFKKIVEDIGNPNDIWIQLIEDNPCLLNEIYPLGREYVDSSQFERELMIFVCVPLAIAFAIPAGAIAGEVVLINLVREVGRQKIKDATLAMIYNALIQTATNYYFNEGVVKNSDTKKRFAAAVDSLSEKEIAIEGLKELVTPKLRGKAAIGCILGGIKYEDDKWYDPRAVKGFDFSSCAQEIFSEYASFLVTKTASPLLKRLKTLIRSNPKQFIRGLRELIRDGNLSFDKSFRDALKLIVKDLKEANFLNVQIDIEEAISEAVKEYAEEVVGGSVKNVDLPLKTANFNLENTIKDAASTIKFNGISDPNPVKNLGANISLDFEGFKGIQSTLLAELEDGTYRMVFVVDKNVIINSIDDFLPHASANRKAILNAIKAGNIPKVTMKGGNATKYFNKTDIEITIKDIEVHTIDGNGNIVKNRIRELANAVGKLETLIDDAVLVVAKNESLPNWIKQSFKNSEYITVQTKQKITLYRDFGDKAFMDGSFSTTINNATRNELALHKSFENSMRFKSTIEVPRGHIIDIGKVGPYPPGTPNALPGGADQIFLPENYSHSWIKEIIDTQTGLTYTVDAFKAAFPNLIKNP